MSVLYRQASKQRYRITLELETQGDFDPYQIHWEDLFDVIMRVMNTVRHM